MLRYRPRKGKGWRISVLVVLIALLASGAAAAPALLQSVERPRAVGGAGGGSITVDGVTLRSTLGQPFVGSNTNDGVTLGHGFWHGAETGYTVYLPLVLRGD
jgi:opacity protein-like surface antigen